MKTRPDFFQQLEHNLRDPLPAEKAWLKMAPVARTSRLTWPEKNEHSRRAGVMLMLYERNGEIHLPLFLRNTYKGVHSNQVGLPGGTFELADGDLQKTALRETEEEIGVNANQIQVLGRLTELFIPPSQFWVQPFIGFHEGLPSFKPDPTEVQELIDAPLRLFLDPTNQTRKTIQAAKGIRYEVPCFEIMGHTVWGATAMMMSEFAHIVERATR